MFSTLRLSSDNFTRRLLLLGVCVSLVSCAEERNTIRNLKPPELIEGQVEEQLADGVYPLSEIADSAPFSKILSWAEALLGEPVYKGSAFVEINPRFNGNPNVVRQPDRRVLRIGSVELGKGRHRYIAHEIVHLLYQSDRFLDRPRAQVEAWATFIETKFVEEFPTERANTSDRKLPAPRRSCDFYDGFLKYIQENTSGQRAAYDFVSGYLFQLDEKEAWERFSVLQKPGMPAGFQFGSDICDARERLREWKYTIGSELSPVLSLADLEQLKAFQNDHGLLGDGLVGAKTLAALRKRVTAPLPDMTSGDERNPPGPQVEVPTPAPEQVAAVSPKPKTPSQSETPKTNVGVDQKPVDVVDATGNAQTQPPKRKPVSEVSHESENAAALRGNNQVTDVDSDAPCLNEGCPLSAFSPAQRSEFCNQNWTSRVGANGRTEYNPCTNPNAFTQSSEHSTR